MDISYSAETDESVRKTEVGADHFQNAVRYMACQFTKLLCMKLLLYISAIDWQAVRYKSIQIQQL